MGSPQQHKAAAKNCAVFFLVVILSSVTLSNNIVNINYYMEYTPETRRIASRVSLGAASKTNNMTNTVEYNQTVQQGQEQEQEKREKEKKKNR